jgi:coenzyme Q-binding protein COQ10
MPSFKTTRRVRHSAAEMFDLVADVEKYPLFLPMCTGLRVRRRTTDAAGNEVLVAEMSVGYKAIRESFTSRVTLDRPNQKILVEYIDGPFSHLENVWAFQDTGEAASSVDFAIDYEFRSRMLGILMGGLFDAAFRKFAEAFERRADIVYGSAARRTPAST